MRYFIYILLYFSGPEMWKETMEEFDNIKLELETFEDDEDEECEDEDCEDEECDK